MRLLIVTQSDPFFLPGTLRLLLEKLQPEHECEVIELRAFNESPGQNVKRILGLYGVVGFLRLLGRIAAIRLGATLSDLKPLTTERTGLSGVTSDRGVLHHVVETVNNDRVVELASSFDIVVSVAASEIFKRPFLDSPRIGCINLHSARLPRHRGMLPTFWSLLETPADLHVTVHWMTREIDKGRYIVQEPYSVPLESSLFEAIAEAKNAGVGALKKAVDLIETYGRDTTDLPIDGNLSSYRSFPQSSDARRFRKETGRSLV